jgi:hypothetical protein
VTHVVQAIRHYSNQYKPSAKWVLTQHFRTSHVCNSLTHVQSFIRICNTVSLSIHSHGTATNIPTHTRTAYTHILRKETRLSNKVNKEFLTCGVEVKERVELYLYSSSRPSWPVMGWTLHFLYHN